MRATHFGTSLFLLATLVACGDGTPSSEEKASPAASAASDPKDVLAGLPPEAQPYGLDVYTAKCVSCHGDLGQGIDNSPALRGLTPAAMQEKLLAYRAGQPQGAQTAVMAQAVASLSDAEIAAVSLYAGE
ncbi:MAG TPA: hypothetical protein DEB56_06575 [Thiobacillus sp.]|nr:hypothetical protein [Thiobacillus sp.]